MAKLRFKVLLFFFSLVTSFAFAQQDTILSPSDFLGYEVSSRFSFHHQVVGYFEKIANISNKVKLVSYGTTYENRPLVGTYISSEKNLAKLEQILKNNRIMTGLEKGKIIGEKLPIIWLSYNVHGDEAASSEAAMLVLYELVSSQKPKVKAWLDNVLIIIDPCLNPDGRERFVGWFKQSKGQTPTIDPNAYEHNQPWPNGRFNHYFFDLNRDWAFLTQKESQHRIAFYRKVMPQVHIDFHEMSIESPYFFGPSVKPFHQEITNWQKEFQEIAAKNTAKHFDRNGWLYFSKETFDMLYPGYGDTWPTFNGAVGFTYEQGGSKKAGLKTQLRNGNILTLHDRVLHHFTASLAAIETVFMNKEKLLSEFQEYFKSAVGSPKGKYKTYLIRNENKKETVPSQKTKALLKLLDNQGIKYGTLGNGTKKGKYSAFSFRESKDVTIEISENDILISTSQPLSKLVNVLFEPNTFLEDSLTYDLTAWSLPYAYGLEAYALKTVISSIEKQNFTSFQKNITTAEKEVYGFVLQWESVKDVVFLSELLKNKIKVRFASEPFEMEKRAFKIGSLLITRADNEQLAENFETKILELANQLEQKIMPVFSAQVKKGKDLGSPSFKLIEKPKVAAIIGQKVTPTSLGEFWHYFDQELQFPISLLHADNLKEVNLNNYDVVFLASGNYTSQKLANQLLDFVSDGGKLIAVRKALKLLSGRVPTALKQKKEVYGNNKNSETFINSKRSKLSKRITGSVYKINLDPTHYLSSGLTTNFYMLKINNVAYQYLKDDDAYSIGTIKENAAVSGFVGQKVKSKLENSLEIGIEKYGKGTIIYIADSPIIRGFWQSGKLLIANAVFFE